MKARLACLIVVLACLLGIAKAQTNAAQGEYLVRAGGCMSCHTADPARPFAGGRPIATPFGNVFAPNITSDRETGIGAWTDAQFVRAMREGIGSNGERLYPAFPYTAYTLLSDADLLAMRAWLATVPPVRAATPRNTLAFPFDQRWLMTLWNLVQLFAGALRARSVEERGVESRRVSRRRARALRRMSHAAQLARRVESKRAARRRDGRGLAGGQPHAGARRGHRRMARRRTAALSVDGRRAWPRLCASGRWRKSSPRARNILTPADLRAMIAYMRAVPPVAVKDARSRTSFGRPARTDITALDTDGARLYAAACASCHGMTGEGSKPFPSLVHDGVTGALGTATTSNLVLVILHGVNRQTRDAYAQMPAFAAQLTDEQIAALSNYVTRQFGDPRATTDAKAVARLRSMTQ